MNRQPWTRREGKLPYKLSSSNPWMFNKTLKG